MSRLEVEWSTRTFWLMVLLGLACTSQAALFSSTLPASRSVQVGDATTFFGTIINASSVAAVNRRVELLSPIDASLSCQPATAQNAQLGNADTPVDIDANQSQAFILCLTANSVVDPVQVEFTFTCDNNGPAAIFTRLKRTIGPLTVLWS